MMHFHAGTKSAWTETRCLQAGEYVGRAQTCTREGTRESRQAAKADRHIIGEQREPPLMSYVNQFFLYIRPYRYDRNTRPYRHLYSYVHTHLIMYLALLQLTTIASWQ